MKRASKLSASAAGAPTPTARPTSHHPTTKKEASLVPPNNTAAATNPTPRYSFRRQRGGAPAEAKAPSTVSPRFALPTASSQSRQRKASAATSSPPAATSSSAEALGNSRRPSTRPSLLSTRRAPLSSLPENHPPARHDHGTASSSKAAVAAAAAAAKRNNNSRAAAQHAPPAQRLNRFSRRSKISVPPLSEKVANPSAAAGTTAATSQRELAVATASKVELRPKAPVVKVHEEPKSSPQKSPRKILGISSPWHAKNGSSDTAAEDGSPQPLLNLYQPSSRDKPSPVKTSPQPTPGERLGISPPWSQHQPQQQLHKESETPTTLANVRPLPPNTPSASTGMLSTVFGLFSTTVWEQPPPVRDESSEEDSQSDIPATILLSRQSIISVSSQLSEDSLSECSTSFESSSSTSQLHSLETTSSSRSSTVPSQPSSAQMHRLLVQTVQGSPSGTNDYDEDEYDDDEEEDHQASRELLQFPSGLTIPAKADYQVNVSGLDSSTYGHNSITDGERKPTPIPSSDVDDQDESDQLSFSRPPLSQRAKSLLVGCLGSDTDDGTAIARGVDDAWRAQGSDEDDEHDSTGIFHDDEPSFPLDLSSVESCSPVKKALSNKHETPAIDEAMQLFRHTSEYPWLAADEEDDTPPPPRRRIDADMLLLPIPSLRQELEAFQKCLPQKKPSKSPMAPTTEEPSLLEESRDDDGGPEPAEAEDVTPKATAPFGWMSWMNSPSPLAVVSREQRRGLTNCGLLLQIPSLREELQEAKERSSVQQTSPPMEEISEGANEDGVGVEESQPHVRTVDALGAVNDDASPSQTSPTTSGSSPQSQSMHEWVVNTADVVRVNDRTVLRPIAEDGMAHLWTPSDIIQELQGQVSTLMKKNKELENKLHKSYEERVTPFRDVFDQMRALRSEKRQLEDSYDAYRETMDREVATLRDAVEQISRAYMARQLEQELQLDVKVDE